MEILHFEHLGDTSVISECSLGVNLVIDKIPQGGIYPHTKFESDRLNIFRVTECSHRLCLRADAMLKP